MSELHLSASPCRFPRARQLHVGEPVLGPFRRESRGGAPQLPRAPRQHRAGAAVAHERPGLPGERPGLTLQGHHLLSGLAPRGSVLRSRHEFRGPRQPTGGDVRASLAAGWAKSQKWRGRGGCWGVWPLRELSCKEHFLARE